VTTSRSARRVGRQARNAGPVVRPYALTAGRTRPSGPAIDLVALVCAIGSEPGSELELEHEHRRVLQLCQRPISVADLAATLDLPLGVIRILVADLRERGFVSVKAPTPIGLSDMRILKEVADALRKL
jgi:hypothetical protein